MNVNDMIANLQVYASQKPENGLAEVMIAGEGGCCGISRADDYKGIISMAYIQLLVLVPDPNVSISVREMKRQ